MANASKFNGKSSDYHLYRPDYPEALLDDIIFEGHLDQYSIIADIGSGTGIMTKKWLNRSMKTYGVEPNGEMRKIAEETLGGNPLFFSIDGSAETIGLPAESIDLIIAAQAFHWFNQPLFKKECQRILAPHGQVALV